MTIISAIAADEIEMRRETIVGAMARHIARPDHRVAREQHTELADALLTATVTALRGQPPTIEPSLQIDRNVASRFGDGILPVLKDVLGHTLPPSAYSRVSDAYWRMINNVGVAAE